MIKKKAYVIGANVSTSLSPTIFQYWFNKLNINGEYGYIEVKNENFDKEICSILKKDGLVGLNITMPFKEKIIPHLTSIENKKARLPVNCISIHGDEIIGQNTDYIGFESACNAKFKVDHTIGEHQAIVLGYGGAAKAIIHSLISIGYSRVMIFNRTFDKIKNLKHVFAENNTNLFNCDLESHTINELPKKIRFAELIINTTPVNMLSDFPKWDIDPNCVGFDVVYRPREGTGFLKHFKPHNRIEGIQMLVYQAAPCFKLWFGKKPEIDEGLFNILYKKMNKK